MGDDAIMMLGIAAMTAGALMAVPLLVSLVGRFATRLPVALRIAARDAARHGRRTGAAVADNPPMSADHLILQSTTRTAPPDGPAVRQTVESVVDVLAVAPITLATAEDGAALLARPAGADDAAPASRIAVGDAQLLRALHAADQLDAFEDETLIALDRPRPAVGSVQVTDGGTDAMGVAVAIPTGWLPAALVLASSAVDYPVTVPWIMMAGAFLAAVLAGLGAALASREPDVATVLHPPA